MNPARITLFAGHYGSGKTQLAINYAVWLKQTCDTVTLADLDIVNPYFRTSDSAVFLSEQGIRLIASPFAGSNVDVPSLPSATQSIFDETRTYAVLDVGGDDRGALALGRYASQLMVAQTSVLLVLNQSRPQTRSIDDVLLIKQEIEAVSRILFTGIVNNTHLGADTTAQTVIDSHLFALSVAETVHLPLVMTTVTRPLFDAVAPHVVNPFAIDIFHKEQFIRRRSD